MARKHLKKSPMLNSTFRQINNDLFKNELPETECYINPKLSRANGRFCRKGKTGEFWIEIAQRLVEYDRSNDDNQVYATMVHESVHLWQYINGLAVNHDSRFKAKMRQTGVNDEAVNLGKYQYRCLGCDNVFRTAGKIKVETKVCAHCNGKIEYVGVNQQL